MPDDRHVDGHNNSTNRQTGELISESLMRVPLEEWLVTTLCERLGASSGRVVLRRTTQGGKRAAGVCAPLIGAEFCGDAASAVSQDVAGSWVAELGVDLSAKASMRPGLSTLTIPTHWLAGCQAIGATKVVQRTGDPEVLSGDRNLDRTNTSLVFAAWGTRPSAVPVETMLAWRDLEHELADLVNAYTAVADIRMLYFSRDLALAASSLMSNAPSDVPIPEHEWEGIAKALDVIHSTRTYSRQHQSVVAATVRWIQNRHMRSELSESAMSALEKLDRMCGEAGTFSNGATKLYTDMVRSASDKVLREVPAPRTNDPAVVRWAAALASWIGLTESQGAGGSGSANATSRDTVKCLEALLTGGPPRPLQRLRTWLQLRIALDVLSGHPKQSDQAGGPSIPDHLPAPVWNAVDTVIRECLRYEAHMTWLDARGVSATPGQREGAATETTVPGRPPFAYTFPARKVLDALIVVTEEHARLFAKLPLGLDLGAALRAIGEHHDHSDIDGFSHLQHVLDCYALATFLLQCSPSELGGTESGTTVERHLAGGGLAGESQRIELRQKVVLSTLMHDVGLLIHPGLPRLGEPLCHGDAALVETTQGIRNAIATSGMAVAQRCATELRGAGIWRGHAEPGLARWVDHQERTGNVQHGLTGAWWLFRRCQSVRRSLAKEVVEGAVRAVLLHNAGCERIDSRRDPAAALLALCDEVMYWDPFKRGPADPRASARTLEGRTIDFLPHRPRVAEVGFGRPSESTPRSSGSPDSYTSTSWPVIHITLSPTHYLQESLSECMLVVSQNVGRIVPDSGDTRAPEHHFRPRVVMEANKMQLRATLEAMERAALRSRTPMAGEMRKAVDRLRECSDLAGGGDAATSPAARGLIFVQAEGRLLSRFDIRQYLRQFEDEVLTARSEIEEVQR